MQFFELSTSKWTPPLDRRALWFDAIEDIPAYRYFLGEVVPREPVVFKRQEGSLARDLMGGTAITNNLVSQAFIDALESNGITGWSTYPVRLFGKADQELPGYYGLAVTGRSGPADKSRSRVVRHRRADGSLVVRSDGSIVKRRYGWFIDPETWDGMDLFVVGTTRAICVTVAAKEKLEAAGLTGLAWTANEEMFAGDVPREDSGGHLHS